MACLRTITEGLPERINVLELGGVVKGRYKDDDQVDANQYLPRRAFLSRSVIPDIKPNTKTINICGIPLNKLNFKDRWLPPKAAGGRQEPPGGEYQFGPDERISSYDVLLTEVKERGLTYMASYPGLDERAKNIALHGSINRLLEDNERPTLMELVEMRDSIDYRMRKIMGAATAYKKFWDLDMPDCEKVDVDAYVGSNVRRAFALVGKYALFDEPTRLQGHNYVKGLKYIACCIAEAGWSHAEATAKLDSLVKYKETAEPTSGIPHIDGMSRLVSMIKTKILEFEREIRQELTSISQRTKRRIRGLSPSKPDTTRQKKLPEGWD